MATAESGRGLVEWSIAVTPYPGETVAGDRGVVVEHDGQTLVAAVDGLGHGPAAARAADAAADVLRAFRGESLVALAQRCHEALRGTRGAALSLASFSRLAQTMTWLGVGNVEGRLVRRLRPASSLLLRPGVAGDRLPPLTEETMDVLLGDTLLFATDGVACRFADGPALSGSTREIADRILGEYAKRTDDALVVVARFLGDGS